METGGRTFAQYRPFTRDPPYIKSFSMGAGTDGGPFLRTKFPTKNFQAEQTEQNGTERPPKKRRSETNETSETKHPAKKSEPNEPNRQPKKANRTNQTNHLKKGNQPTGGGEGRWT